MAQTDLLLMSLVIFLPSLFALGLMFFPKKTEDYQRWFTLIGTAATLGVSAVLFVDYLALLDANHGQVSETTINKRADVDRSNFLESKSLKSDDLVGRRAWIPRFNIEYFLGVDGISMPLVLLTTVLFFLSMIASWGIEKHVKGYCMLFLFLETGVLGTFLSLDFFLFYIFWEVMLLPMYFLIGIWGGPRREYAAIKFFLYTLLGSVFILIAMLAFYFTNVRDFADPKLVQEKAAELAKIESKKAGKANSVKPADVIEKVEIHTFDLTVLMKAGKAALTYLSADEKTVDAMIADIAKTTGGKPEAIRDRLDHQAFFQPWFQYTMFLFLFVGFAIKVPVFPFHTWLPDAHVEAPTPISMILAGILLKLGGYGILRIAYPICPWAAYSLANYLVIFGLINIVYGAFAAMAQTDFKKLVAYSSISHMGYVILGIAVWSAGNGAQYWAWGINGAMYQMIGHGVSSAGMFFMVGVIYDRAHHRNLDNFRGLFEPMPVYGGISAIIFFAALGLPGMCGFVGEFMVVLATWNYNRFYAGVAAAVVVITAAYILWTLQRVYFGVNPAYKDYEDINLRELSCAVPLVVLCVLLGVMPSLLLTWMEPHVTGLIDSFLK